MFCSRVSVLFVVLCVMVTSSLGLPDSAGHVPLPGPGLAHGGIPYGSVSGNVAEFYKSQAPSGDRSFNLAGQSNFDYAPIEQYLR